MRRLLAAVGVAASADRPGGRSWRRGIGNRVAAFGFAGLLLGQCAPNGCTPTPVTAPIQVVAPTIQEEVVARVNAERAAYGARQVTTDRLLQQAAQAHAEDQASMDHWSHSGSDGDAPQDRLARVGYVPCDWGESVEAGSVTAALVVQSWMGSPTHRDMLLNDNYHEAGYGRAVGASGYVYSTLYLATPC